MRLSRIFAKPSALEIAASELEQAKRDHLIHSARREYYAAIEEMLEVRIERLEAAVKDLATQQDIPS